MPSMVIKIGGSVLHPPMMDSLLLRELSQLDLPQLAIVHGGGKTIDGLFEKFGYTPEFQQGVRMTSSREMPLVDMALSGAVNTEIVRGLCKAGKKAIGISGADANFLLATPMVHNSHTGKAQSCQAALLYDLWQLGYLPVIAPVSSSAQGQAMNVNADEAADHIARALKGCTLVFVTDVTGILLDGTTIRNITLESGKALLEGSGISGGMIVKLKSALASLQAGLSSVHIGSVTEPGDLATLLKGERGTHIHV